MWELEYREGWELKTWCLQTVMLEKTLRGALDCKIRPLNPQGNQPWMYFWSTNAETETRGFCQPDTKRQLWKTSWQWEIFRTGGERGDRGWDGWTASLIQWTCVWTNYGKQWKRGRPGVLQSRNQKRVAHDWMNEQQQSKYLELFLKITLKYI